MQNEQPLVDPLQAGETLENGQHILRKEVVAGRESQPWS